MNYRTAFMACTILAAVFTGCDEDSGSVGITDWADIITSSEDAYDLHSRSILLDSVVANSTKSYLGEVYDPETNTSVRAEFLSQFYTIENYSLPAYERIIKNANGELEADSVDVRIYYSNYYGSATNPMKIQVYELDPNHILREDQTYYSDINIDDYLSEGATPLCSKTFTPADYTLPDAERTSSKHYDNVRVRLPQSFGTRILRAAHEHPEWFMNSWQFIHHVCPGLYFKLHSGRGTMLELDVAAMNVYFRYRDAEKDTIYEAVSRFSATPEVIQSTRIQNDGLEALLDPALPYTYLKSPAGIATEVTLPVDELFLNHEGDSINRARLILTRLNSSTQDENVLPMPQSLLMVRKQALNAFFRNRQVADGLTSYTTFFDANSNNSPFNNLSVLISTLHQEKLNGMKRYGLTSQQWNDAHPDWNKVVLTPVVITTNTSNQGTTSQTSVTHNFSLTSARLVGGSKPLSIQVIYSSYKR